MRELIEWTAWGMEKPQAYGTFHLTFVAVGLAVSVLLAWLLRKSSDKFNRIFLITIGCVLVAGEIYRQLFLYYVTGEPGVWKWWAFPFQMCDIPMYMCIIAPLLPKGKVQSAMYNFMLAFNLMGGFVSFIEPSGLVHKYWTLTLHAFIWHMTLVFIGLYLGFSRRAGLKISDYKGAAITFFILCGAAFCLNCALWNVSDGSINMFYVGPGISSIIVFKQIATALGWYVNTPIYMFCLCLAALLFFLPFCLWNKKKGVQETPELEAAE